ncbi:MAG TPA: PRC-barrel domain-containing protein, partial [Clostridia bacterium]|nr:PRC-barrel domain-containing protein [Clostridia bacterium]
RLGASDGEIGHLKDLYFDDQTWTVRYLVADTGTWLAHRKVLLSPYAVTGIHTKPHPALEVRLTRQQIEESPPIERHQPVSRRFETQYFQYYGWPYYWPGPLLWGPADTPAAFFPPPTAQRTPAQPQSSEEDAHLRSMNEMTGFAGYQLQALDQAFGHVEQFIIDDESWAIRYLVADTRNWWPSKRVLLSPQWVAWVSWSDAKVYVDLDSETIRRAPEFDPSLEVTREYERQLFDHYNREPYWVRPAEMASK